MCRLYNVTKIMLDYLVVILLILKWIPYRKNRRVAQGFLQVLLVSLSTMKSLNEIKSTFNYQFLHQLFQLNSPLSKKNHLKHFVSLLLHTFLLSN